MEAEHEFSSTEAHPPGAQPRQCTAARYMIPRPQAQRSRPHGPRDTGVTQQRAGRGVRTGGGTMTASIYPAGGMRVMKGSHLAVIMLGIGKSTRTTTHAITPAAAAGIETRRVHTVDAAHMRSARMPHAACICLIHQKLALHSARSSDQLPAAPSELLVKCQCAIHMTSFLCMVTCKHSAASCGQ